MLLPRIRSRSGSRSNKITEPVKISTNFQSNSNLASARGYSLLMAQSPLHTGSFGTPSPSVAVLPTPEATHVDFAKPANVPNKHKLLSQATADEIERLRQKIKDIVSGRNPSNLSRHDLKQVLRRFYTMLRLLTSRKTSIDLSKSAVSEQIQHTSKVLETQFGKLTKANLLKLQQKEALMLDLLAEVFNEQELSQGDLTAAQKHPQ